ncbi:MAG: hypothetical protein WC124_01500 [Desulfoplanes sp.]
MKIPQNAVVPGSTVIPGNADVLVGTTNINANEDVGAPRNLSGYEK